MGWQVSEEIDREGCCLSKKDLLGGPLRSFIFTSREVGKGYAKKEKRKATFAINLKLIKLPAGERGAVLFHSLTSIA